MNDHEVFAAAVKLSGEQRDAFLAAACDQDLSLRQRVESLLVAHDESGGAIPYQVDRDLEATQLPAFTHKVGSAIGPYKLLEEIGEGGMGTVWVAQQTEPIKRKVAIKLIKAGMDSKSVLARFEAERQALALMDHPNIARVLDGGMTEQGRPYFAMEYVKGVPLTQYCDRARLSIRERLELFMPICQAVQHAHQKGIIHRDLKPSNILVCLYDGKPVPKVIDFGLAKAMHHSLTERSLYTAHGVMVGTPLYMSPEQAEHNNLDIDTRTDIYSLGVILYELLTGSTPLEKAQMKQAAVNEIMRLIKEVEAPKPSTRLSGSASLPSVAAQRSIEPANLQRKISGDLDWVVMKALEKERSRRYETANGLAADIERHLSDEPVSASPPSRKYRMQKFIKRNRTGVTAAGLVAAALLLGMIGTTVSTIWAIGAQRDEAVARQDALDNAEQAREAAAEAEREKQNAEAETKRAEHELARATQIKRLITEMLQSVDPEIAQSTDIALLKGILEDAANRLKSGEISDELVAGELHHLVGGLYRRLGLYEEASLHLPVALEIAERMLGKEHNIRLLCLSSLALLYMDQGRSNEAEQLLQETLEIRRRVFGVEHLSTSDAMNNLAVVYKTQGRFSDAEPLYLKSLETLRRLLGNEHEEVLKSMHNLAGLYQAQGLIDKADALFIKVLEVFRRDHGEEHPRTLQFRASLAIQYMKQGRHAEAEKLLPETLQTQRRVLGEEHPDTLLSMNNLSLLYKAQGRLDEAETLILETRNIHRSKLGEEHPDTLLSTYNLANFYEAQGRDAEAETLGQNVLEIRRRVLGPEHPETLASLDMMTLLNKKQARYSEAEKLCLETLEIRRRVFGEEHPETLDSMNRLAELYQAQVRYTEAEKICLETIDIRRRVLGEVHPATLQSMYTLAYLRYDQGRYAEGEPLCRKVLENRRRVLGEENPGTLGTMNVLVLYCLAQSKYAEAVELCVEALEIQRRTSRNEHPNTILMMQNLASAYTQMRKYDEAEKLYRDVLEIRGRRQGAEHPTTLASVTNLASLYLSMNRFEEVATMLAPNVANKRRVLGADHPWTVIAIGLLASTYENLDRPDEALKLFREVLEIRRRNWGEEHLDTLGTLTDLGAMYNRMEKYEDAVEMFEISLPIKRRVLGAKHPWTRLARSGLIRSYQQLERPEDALPLLREEFELKAAMADAPEANASMLNDVAWNLLTHEIEDFHDPARALTYAERACTTEDAKKRDKLWMYLDTLALAQHRTGDSSAAMETQIRAVSLLPKNAKEREEMEQRLAEFKKVAKDSEADQLTDETKSNSSSEK